MIAAFSSSSSLSSVCLVRETGEVLWSGEEEASMRASTACLALLERGLEESRLSLEDFRLFAADIGPGSFTGVRVGVVLAKTLAWNQGAMCAGVDSFDLVDAGSTVVLPSRRGEYFVRMVGSDPFRTMQCPEGAVGYGFEGGDRRPMAKGVSKLVGSLAPVAPVELVPHYLIEPSISTSKKPLARIQSG